MLNRPQPFNSIETINDIDGLVSNFWRAVQADPDKVAQYADWPVAEPDLHARHSWLTKNREKFTRRIEGDPDYYSAKVAGWWCWGVCLWIGSGFCTGNGAWVSVSDANGNLRLVKRKDLDDGEDDSGGVSRQSPRLSAKGQGIHKEGVTRQLDQLANAGKGVHRRIVRLGNNGQGIHSESKREAIYAWMRELSARLRGARICCGSWERICTPTVTYKLGMTGVFLDPPYGDEANRANELYRCDSMTVSKDVLDWCLENGDNENLRIALCGYEGEHKLPKTWEKFEWKARGGYSGQSIKHDNPNSRRERIWFSPHCLKPVKRGFFV